MPRKLSDAVVVITGASSGIGRATTLAFARRGAALALTLSLLWLGLSERRGPPNRRHRSPYRVRPQRDLA